MTMIKLNVHEAKTHLSRFLKRLEEDGETIVLCRRNVPIAELKPIATPPSCPRSLGQGPREDGYELPDTFWEPLPEELTTAFSGVADTPASGTPRRD